MSCGRFLGETATLRGQKRRHACPRRGSGPPGGAPRRGGRRSGSAARRRCRTVRMPNMRNTYSTPGFAVRIDADLAAPGRPARATPASPLNSRIERAGCARWSRKPLSTDMRASSPGSLPRLPATIGRRHYRLLRIGASGGRGHGPTIRLRARRAALAHRRAAVRQLRPGARLDDRLAQSAACRWASPR